MKNSDNYNVLNKIDPLDSRLPDNSMLKGVYEIGRQICAMSNAQQIVEKVIVLISEILPSDRCIIVRSGDKGIMPMAHNLPDLPEDFNKWPLSRTVIKNVLDTKEAILGIEGNDETFETDKYASIVSKGIKSFICTCFKIGELEYGVVYVDSIITKKCFDNNDFYFLAALTSFIELAMNNAKVIDEEKTKSKEYKAQYTEKVKKSIIGQSAEMKKALNILEKVAVRNEPVLILGERGTGKELFARAVHDLSQRSLNTYLTLNVTTIPTTLLESELFGYEPGTFTGAKAKRQPGYLFNADKGTLFLDEIGEMTIDAQSKLLRVLDGYGYRRLGGKELVKPDIRYVFATNKDLIKLQADGLFKQDFYDRISVFKIRIPPLRKRKGDIKLLINFFKKTFSLEKTYSPKAIEFLESLEWEGNIRQLINVLKRADILCDGSVIDAKDIDNEIILDDDINRTIIAPGSLSNHLASLSFVEREHIKKVLIATGDLSKGRIKKAAEILDITVQTVHNKIKEHDLSDYL